MSETSQIILLICLLVIVFALTRKVHAWRIKQAYIHVIKDLEQQRAFDPSSAIELLYAKIGVFRFGMRDYRPKAVEYLIVSNIVGMTESGRYYLKNKKTDNL
ncbi:MAG: hypothetical protein JRI72_08010 [Deltaproteobacteria bacterium]|nr:hypothetical protein [Deltaproteobacteria bacterium]